MNEDLHAYCIMAHGNWEQLQTLVGCLDDRRNHIFLHIDKKSLTSYNKWGGVKCEHSHLTTVKQAIDTRWGDVSLLETEMSLFCMVAEAGKDFKYVHLLSGVDLPLKSQDYIHNYFLRQKEQYIQFADAGQFLSRLKHFHFFVRYVRIFPFADLLRKALIKLQVPFVNRMKHCSLTYAYGSNWCSLTMEAVHYLVDNIGIYKRYFKHTLGCDEFYKQMILSSCPTLTIAPKEIGNLRYVDWSGGKGSPKVLRMNDYGKIIGSNCLFARKFDQHIDNTIIDRILSDLNS